jgi:hypothetical protein
MRRLGRRFNRSFFDRRRSRHDWSGLDDGWRRRLDAWGFRNGRSFGYRRGRGSDSLRWRWRDGRRFFYRSRRLRGSDCFDQPRRSKDGCRRLRRFRLLRRGGLLRTALRRCRRLGKHIAGRQRYATLPRDALDKRPCDDLFDGAGRALQLDAVIAFEQRQHFLAGGAEQLRDFVNPNCCQCVPLVKTSTTVQPRSKPPQAALRSAPPQIVSAPPPTAYRGRARPFAPARRPPRVRRTAPRLPCASLLRS